MCFAEKLCVRRPASYENSVSGPYKYFLSRGVAYCAQHAFFISDEPLAEKDKKNAHLHEVLHPSNQQTNQPCRSAVAQRFLYEKSRLYANGWCWFVDFGEQSYYPYQPA